MACGHSIHDMFARSLMCWVPDPVRVIGEDEVVSLRERKRGSSWGGVLQSISSLARPAYDCEG